MSVVTVLALAGVTAVQDTEHALGHSMAIVAALFAGYGWWSELTSRREDAAREIVFQIRRLVAAAENAPESRVQELLAEGDLRAAQAGQW